VRVIDETPDGPSAGPWRTVVGIAGDVRQAYDDPDRGDFYTPKVPDGRYGTFYLRTNRAPMLLFGDLRSAAADIDPEAVISEPRQLTDDDQKLAGTRFLTMVLTGFALTAAFLAMLGIYGVTAYAVQQRHKEVAIRMALGASPGRIMRMFLRHGGVLLALGTAAGLAGGVLLSRVLRQQVFGVQSADLLTYAAASALLIAAGLAAVWWPARRAARVHPAGTLNAG
jgi:ABC-type antimicrobial peptide transport system permease subunit